MHHRANTHEEILAWKTHDASRYVLLLNVEDVNCDKMTDRLSRYTGIQERGDEDRNKQGI